MTTGKEYLKQHQQCGLKVGDRVLITRIAADYEQGWVNSWCPSMDALVNTTQVITSDAQTLGFRLSGVPYSFPYFVLSKVDSQGSKIPQPDNSDYNPDGSLRKSEYNQGGLKFL